MEQGPRPSYKLAQLFLQPDDTAYIAQSMSYLRKRSLITLALLFFLHAITIPDTYNLYNNSEYARLYFSIKYTAFALSALFFFLWVKQPTPLLYRWNFLVLMASIVHVTSMSIEFAAVPAEVAFFYLCAGFLLAYSIPIANLPLLIGSAGLLISYITTLQALFPNEAYLVSYLALPTILIVIITIQSVLIEQYRRNAYQVSRQMQLEIALRKKIEEQIKYLANHDALTGLPSLRLARERLDYALNMAKRHQQKVGVMFIDLDGFKAINDSFGHDMGDQLLIEIAKRLTHCVRQSDTVARIGGDEFLLIQTEVEDKESALMVADKLIGVVAEPVVISDRSIEISASIGISFYPDNGTTSEVLLKRADDAMYIIKRSCKNNYSLATS